MWCVSSHSQYVNYNCHLFPFKQPPVQKLIAFLIVYIDTWLNSEIHASERGEATSDAEQIRTNQAVGRRRHTFVTHDAISTQMDDYRGVTVADYKEQSVISTNYYGESQVVTLTSFADDGA